VKQTLAVFLLAALGCSRATTPPLDIKATREWKPVRTLAVVPVTPSPLTVGDGAARAPEVVSRMLLDAASREAAWKLVDPDRVDAALKSMRATGTPEEKAGAVATRLGADGALTATIATYRERVGSDYGVTQPASVSIQVLLVPVGAKQAAWKADYTFTQEPLAYNLLNLWGVIRGGPKWLTADELARIGIDEAVKRLAKGRESGL